MKTPKMETTKSESVVKGYEEEKSTTTAINKEEGPTTNTTNITNITNDRNDDILIYLNSELKRFKDQKEQNIRQSQQLKENLFILSGAIQMIEHVLMKFNS